MDLKDHTKDQKKFDNFKDLGNYYRDQEGPRGQKDSKGHRNHRDQKNHRNQKDLRNHRDSRDFRDQENWNAPDWNAPDWNTPDWNTPDWNTPDWNTPDDRDYIFFKLSKLLYKYQLSDTDIEKVVIKTDPRVQYLHVPSVLSVLRKTPIEELSKLNSSLRFILKNGDMINCITNDKNSVVEFIYKKNPTKLVDIVTGDSAVKKLLLIEDK